MKFLKKILLSLLLICNVYSAEVINHQVEYRTPPIATSYIVTNNNGTSTTLGGAGSWTNVPPIFNTNNACMAGILDTNYTIYIPATWSVQDIYAAVDKVPPIFSGASTKLNLVWTNHCDYSTNAISVDRIANRFSVGTTFNQNFVFSNGPPIVLSGSYQLNGQPCTLSFADNPVAITAEGMLNVFGAKNAIMIDNLTLVYTNGTRPGTGIRVHDGSMVSVRNIAITNASTGFMVNYAGSMQVYTNCRAVNCGNGFGGFTPTSMQFQESGSLATNCSNGFIVYRGATMLGDSRNLRAHCCDVGFYALYKATLFAYGASAISNRYCFYAQDGGWIHAATATYSSYVYEADPYFDTMRNNGSMVYKAGPGQTNNLYLPAGSTEAQFQALIDSVGENLNGSFIVMNLPTGTIDITTGITVSDFTSGIFDIRGTNWSAYANATNQATILNGAAGSTADQTIYFYRNSASMIALRGVKITPPGKTSANCLYSLLSPMGRAQYNCYFGTTIGSDNNGNYATTLSTMADAGSSTVQLNVGWRVNNGAAMTASSCNTAGTIPAYAGYASQGSILFSGTNYQGSTAKFAVDTGGLIVTNTGKILP